MLGMHLQTALHPLHINSRVSLLLRETKGHCTQTAVTIAADAQVLTKDRALVQSVASRQDIAFIYAFKGGNAAAAMH